MNAHHSPAAYPDPPLTMDEAAERLGVSRRTLSAALRELPFFEARGRKKVFYPEHITQLRQGMHECAFKSNGSTAGHMPTAPVLMASASAALSALKTLAEPKKRGRT
jgi:hypothetical protein